MQKKWIKSTILLFIQILIWQLIIRNETISNLWFNYITINYNKIVYYLTSEIAFPIGEIFYFLVGIIVLFLIIKSIKNREIYIIINTISFIYFVYNSVWGVAYYKTTFSEATKEIKIDKNILIKLYCEHLNKAELYRYSINKSNNQVTKFKYDTNNYLEEFKTHETKIKREKWITNYLLINNPTVKFSNFSLAMSYFGILGYYNPFTIESNVNRTNTDLKKPFTIFHELAHQMGFASENQANFIAYYIGIHSNYNEVKYATYYKTMFSLLAAIAKYDSLFVKSQIDNLPQGINIDRKAEIEYYAKYQGTANDTFSTLNDQFLKANNQEGSISYSRYIELVYYYQIILKNKSHL